MGELSGQVLGERYRVDAFLGRGGMADVYKVWDQQRAVWLAMKVLHQDLAENPVFLRRFEREAETLAQLQHPNIVRFYGLEKNGPLAFILMDFIDGLTLRREILLSPGGMRPERAAQIVLPVCAALHYAHRLRMAHCDLKPSNIMIHRNGTVYLSDFGIARATGGTTGSLIGAGTPAYMAPEQFDGIEPTPRTDIYGLGVVLFEMLTGGQRPFTGETAEIEGTTDKKIVWEKRFMPAPSPRRYRSDLSPALEVLVLRCLERDPQARYATTLDLLHALDAAVRGPGSDGEAVTLADVDEVLGVSPEPAIAPEKEAPAWAAQLSAAPGAQTIAPPARSSIRTRTWGRLGFLLAVIVLLTVTTVLAAILQPGAQKAPPTATLPSAAVAPVTAETAPTATLAVTPIPTVSVLTLPTEPPSAPSTAAPSTTATAAPTTIPTLSGGSTGGWQIAFASDRGGTVQVWVIDAMNRDREAITSAEGGACQPTWSPDGTKLAYITPCNGPRLTYYSTDIEIIDLQTREVTKLNLLGGGFDPAWSPDGTQIVFTSVHMGPSEIYAVDLATRQIRPLARREGKNLHPSWSPDGKYIAFTSEYRQVDEIWLMRADGSSQEVLTQAGSLKYFSQPSWSPDGKWILATLKELNTDGPRLVLVDATSPGSPVKETYSGQARVESIRVEDGAFSPDGRWTVYWTTLPGNNMEVFRMELESGAVENLSNHKARDFQPAWRWP